MRSLFGAYREAFRAFIRRRMKPISVVEAEEKREFWAKIYAYSALITFLFVSNSVFMDMFGKKSSKTNLSSKTSSDTNDKQVVIRDFSKVKDYTQTPEELKVLIENKSVSNAVKNSNNSETASSIS